MMYESAYTSSVKFGDTEPGYKPYILVAYDYPETDVMVLFRKNVYFGNTANSINGSSIVYFYGNLFNTNGESVIDACSKCTSLLTNAVQDKLVSVTWGNDEEDTILNKGNKTRQIVGVCAPLSRTELSGGIAYFENSNEKRKTNYSYFTRTYRTITGDSGSYDEYEYSVTDTGEIVQTKAYTNGTPICIRPAFAFPANIPVIKRDGVFYIE